ncbi:MAG: protein-L-isoaspartate(D-aspartate) O-methyltransferase [Candidatus Aenigmatarchaeota archaeon]
MDWRSQQEDMIRLMKERGAIKSKAIEKAIREAPRHLFVPKEQEGKAYEDVPLPIGEGQTISQPSTVALMTWMLDVREGDKVLEIGSGSGWQAAILSNLGAKVWTIERIGELATMAEKNLKKAGIRNVEVIEGDGSLGLKEHAPYDRIIVTCACPEVPKALVDQLKTGGKMVIPVGGRDMQTMLIIRKTAKGIERRDMGNFIFVPLIGKYGFKR